MQGQPGRPGWRGLAILFFLRPRGLAAEDDQSEEQQRKDAGGCRGPLRQHHGCVAAPRSGRTPADGSFWFEGAWMLNQTAWSTVCETLDAGLPPKKRLRELTHRVRLMP